MNCFVSCQRVSFILRLKIFKVCVLGCLNVWHNIMLLTLRTVSCNQRVVLLREDYTQFCMLVRKTDKSKGPAVVIIPDEPAEHLPAGCEAVSAVSQAVCKSAALLSRLPLYEHIMQCRHDEVRFSLNYGTPGTVLNCCDSVSCIMITWRISVDESCVSLNTAVIRQKKRSMHQI